MKNDEKNTQDFNETQKNFSSPMRPSRSHESLASSHLNTIILSSDGIGDYNFQKSATVRTTPNRHSQNSPISSRTNRTSNRNDRQQILDTLFGPFFMLLESDSLEILDS